MSDATNKTDVPHGPSGLLKPGQSAIYWTPQTQPTELRDYFAAHALMALLTVTVLNPTTVRQDAKNAGVTVDELLARDAYTTADAMLKARVK